MKLSLLVTVFIQLSFHVTSDIIKYSHHLIYPDKPEYLLVPKYGKKDIPNWPPGHGRSYIDLSQLSVTVDCEDLKSDSPTNCLTDVVKFELLMFKAPTDESWFNFWPDRLFCCNEENAESGDCRLEDVGLLIIPSDLPAPFVRAISLYPGSPKRLSDEGTIVHHEITESGEYVLFMAVCDKDAAPVILDGSIDSLDPYGYLPGNQFGNLPFYGALSCLYSFLGIIWMIYCSLFRNTYSLITMTLFVQTALFHIFLSDQLISIHFWITCVLALGMIETTVFFGHFLYWNDNGSQAISLLTTALIFGVLKRALSRIVVQFVSLGYGIVRPTIGEDFNRTLYLGSAYFVLSLIYTLATSLPSYNKIATNRDLDVLSIVVIVLAAVDTTFYIWILTSIQNLITSLVVRKQGVKYILYRNFRGVLFVSLFFTGMWALYGTAIAYDDKFGSTANWQTRWSVDALWELTYYALFVAIAFLWAPHKTSQQYAYSIELTQLDDDEEYNADAKKTVDNDSTLDDEYGGKLHDDTDPFLGTGALDVGAATAKKA